MGGINIHISNTPLTVQSRDKKIIQSLADANVFDKIYFIGTWESPLAKVEILDEKQTVIRIPIKFFKLKSGNFWKALRLFEWFVRVLIKSRGINADCINCHALPLLPLCVLLKFIKRAKLVYDTHELETETNASSHLRRHFSKIVERMLIKFGDETIVVSQSIATWYQRKYNLKRVWVVRNIPYKSKGFSRRTELLRNSFGIQEDEILFLYQGLIAEGRGIGLLLDVFSQLNSGRHIVFMGFGELCDVVKDYASRYENIHYYPSVKPNEIIYYSSSADVGVSLIENTCLNYYYCLPNKMWEYLNASLPVLVSNFPEMRNVVEQYRCGWLAEPTADNIKDSVEKITIKDISEKRANVLAAKGRFGWHLEEPTLLNVYRELGFLL